MGIFKTIGTMLGGRVAGSLAGGEGVSGALNTAASGAAALAGGDPTGGALSGGAGGVLGSLLGGGGFSGALKGGLLGGLGGAMGGQSGMSPAAIAALSALASSQLAEQGKQRESAEAAFNARQDLLTRNLGLAETSFADKAPLRNFGMNSLGRFAEGGFGRGIFNTPGEMGQEAGSLAGRPIFQGNSLFGGAGAFAPPVGGEAIEGPSPVTTPVAPSVARPPAKLTRPRVTRKRGGGGGSPTGKAERGDTQEQDDAGNSRMRKM